MEDVADAVDVVWTRGETGQTYNISSDYELSVMDVTKLIIETVKNTTEYDTWMTFVADRPFNDQRYHIDSSKLRKLGWAPKKDIGDLKRFIAATGGF